jgi:hypothetical protein
MLIYVLLGYGGASLAARARQRKPESRRGEADFGQAKPGAAGDRKGRFGRRFLKALEDMLRQIRTWIENSIPESLRPTFCQLITP